MIVLGLGSNIGDRLTHLRNAFQLIKAIPKLTIIQVSPIYISDALLPDNAPESWNTPYLNLAIRCNTTLKPYDLLKEIKEIEIKLGRKTSKDWEPRCVDIDILAWDNFIQYDEVLHIPHEHLHERPFALWPLSDVAPEWIYPLPGHHQGKTAAQIAVQWGSRFNGESPLHTKQIQHRIDVPQLIGILNMTPNSFSDGGLFNSVDCAMKQIKELVAAGTEIIDIGAEATGPDAIAISAEEEWNRLQPVLSELLPNLKNYFIKPKISIDTYHPEVAKKALELGVDWINDVSGLMNPTMQEVISQSNCDVVIMHHVGIPTRRDKTLPLDQDPVALIYQWAEKHLTELTKKGISLDRIIVDPGLCFGKTAQQSFDLFKKINHFRSLGARLLVGHSRKSFLREFTERPSIERDVETLALSLSLDEQSVDYIRVHNVDFHARAFKVMRSVTTSKEES